MKKKILIDCTPLSGGGGVQVAISLLRNMQEQTEFDWMAVIPDGVIQLIPESVCDINKIKSVKKSNLLSILNISLYLGKFEKYYQPDVVFTVFGPPYFRAKSPHLIGFAQPHLIYEFNSGTLISNTSSKIVNYLRTILFKFGDAFIVETEVAGIRLCKTLNIANFRVNIIGNTTNSLIQNECVYEAKDTGPFVVLTPSVYYRHKNLELIPYIAAEIKRKAVGLDIIFRLTLPLKSPEWLRIHAKSKILGVSHLVESLGMLKVTELGKAYRNASAVLLPTLLEVSTAVYPESFFFRRPVVTSDIDFARELCGNAAIFASPNDSTAFADALISLARNKDKRELLVSAGQKRLADAYPTAQAKFAMQMEVFRYLATRSRSNLRSPCDLKNTTSTNLEKLLLNRMFSMESRKNYDIVRPVHDAIKFHDNLAGNWSSGYLKKSFISRKLMLESILDRLVIKGDRWIDLGCGSGTFLEKFVRLGATVTAVDGSSAMIDQARKNIPQDIENSIRWISADIHEISRSVYERYDGIFCSSVIEYSNDPDIALNEIGKILMPGGLLIISIPPAYSLVRFAQKVLRIFAGILHVDLFPYLKVSIFEVDKKTLTRLLEKHNFQIEKITPFDPIIRMLKFNIIKPSLLIIEARLRK